MLACEDCHVTSQGILVSTDILLSEQPTHLLVLSVQKSTFQLGNNLMLVNNQRDKHQDSMEQHTEKI